MKIHKSDVHDFLLIEFFIKVMAYVNFFRLAFFLSLIPLRFIQVIVFTVAHCFLMLSSSPRYGCISIGLTIHPLEGHLHCCQFLANTFKVAVNICIQVFVDISFLFCEIKAQQCNC